MNTLEVLHDIDGKMVEEYRLQKLRGLESTLTTDIEKHTRSLTKYKKIKKTLEGIIHVCNFVNVIFAGGAVGSSGVGLFPAVLPCATIAGLATITNTTLQVINKKIATKKKRHSEKMLLAHRTKNRLQNAISRIADDDIVDASEFDELMELDKSYHEQKINMKM